MPDRRIDWLTPDEIELVRRRCATRRADDVLVRLLASYDRERTRAEELLAQVHHERAERRRAT
jgi:hypothetical protein